jgi:hypothetical protein
MIFSRFNTRPDEHYKSVVAHLHTLSASDQTPAYAEAHADALKAAVAKWLGRQVRGIKSWRRLFGHSPATDDGLPGDDHVELWSGETGMRYVSHPYDLDFETVGEMLKFAQENNLEFSLSGSSWYYPGRTLRVIWQRRNRSLTRDLVSQAAQLS